MRVDDVFAKIWMNLVWLSVHMIVGVQIMKLAVFTMHLFLEYGVGKPSQIWIMNLQPHRAFFDFDVHFAWIAIKVGCSSHDLVVFLHTEFLTVALWSPVSEVTTASPPSGTKFFCLYYFDEHSHCCCWALLFEWFCTVKEKAHWKQFKLNPLVMVFVTGVTSHLPVSYLYLLSVR